MPEAVLYLLKIREFPFSFFFLLLGPPLLLDQPCEQGGFFLFPSLLPLLQAGGLLLRLPPRQ